MPFGGTSGLRTFPNRDPSYDSTVEPPLMNWSGNADFVLGHGFDISSGVLSRFPVRSDIAARPTLVSSSNRWGQITYPNIRFGYKQPAICLLLGAFGGVIPVLYSRPSRLSRSSTAHLAGIRALQPIMFCPPMRFPLNFRSRGMPICKLV